MSIFFSSRMIMVGALTVLIGLWSAPAAAQEPPKTASSQAQIKVSDKDLRSFAKADRKSTRLNSSHRL